MALFSPRLSPAPSGFNPIVDPVDTSVPDAIGDVTQIIGGLAEQRAASQKARLAQEADTAQAGLFAQTLQSEAEVIEGQERLTQNQQEFDRLYQDGIISADEQAQLQRLQRDRSRLEAITNPRQRQVQLRMKYANFVNQYPHLTKEARIMFGDAESRLDDVAQGAQALVNQEAFNELFGEGTQVTAENISTFRNVQRYTAQRKLGLMQGNNNFQDFSTGLKADVTANLFAVGRRMETLSMKQGGLRTEDIDVFNASINTGYMDGIQDIDASIAQLQANGQYVDPAKVQALKNELKATRDNMLAMSEGKDFLTRLKRLNEFAEESFKHNIDMNLPASTRLLMGAGGGGMKGAADILTLKQILQGGAGIDAAKNQGGLYGEQVASLQRGAAELMTFLDNYDSRAAREFHSPALVRHMGQIQSMRLDNGAAQDNPEQANVYINVIKDGGTSDEVAEGLISHASEINLASNQHAPTRTNLQSTVNNYALETIENLRAVGARVRRTEDGYEAFVTGNTGQFRPYTQGTQKLNNALALFQNFDIMGGQKQFESVISDYKNTLNAEIQEVVDSLQLDTMTPALQEKTLNRLQTMYSLTTEELQEIKNQMRGGNGSETPRGGD